MKMNSKTWMMLSIALTLSVAGCKKDKPQTPGVDQDTNVTPTTFTNGIFIINEGPFGSGTGTISFYDRRKALVSNDIFQTANGRPLGNIVQSMDTANGKGYIVVNNASKVEVVNISDFKSVGSIGGLTMPRYFLKISGDKGYVTEWGTGGTQGAVKIINLNSNLVISTIATGKGAEKMVRVGGNIYVACVGGFGKDSVVTVINSISDVATATITVGANPASIQVDANNKVWVLCGGQWNSTYTELEKPGKLVRINPANNTIEETLTFTSKTSSPSGLTINSTGNKLFYKYNGSVCSQNISDITLTETKVIGRNPYGLGIDPINNNIYAAYAAGNSNGWAIRYTQDGLPVDSFQVGIYPGNFFFEQ